MRITYVDEGNNTVHEMNKQWDSSPPSTIRSLFHHSHAVQTTPNLEQKLCFLFIYNILSSFLCVHALKVNTSAKTFTHQKVQKDIKKSNPNESSGVLKRHRSLYTNRFNLDFYSNINIDQHPYLEFIKYAICKLNPACLRTFVDSMF